MANNDDRPGVVRVNSWSFDGDPGVRRGSRVPLFGIFLIVVGLLLAAGQIFPQAKLGAAAFFFAVGVIVALVGVRDRNSFALYAGVVVVALSLADLLSGAGVIHGDGWGTLFIGLALVGIALFRMARGGKLGAAMVIGLLLTAWGGVQVATSSLNVSLGSFVGPVLIVVLGLWLIGRNGRRTV
jgi:hypothetical protein